MAKMVRQVKGPGLSSITAAALPALLALNNAHATELSWLKPARFASLVCAAYYARRVDPVDAFLLAFDQDAEYDSPNYLWFRHRYKRFVYVDRVVVDPAARGRGSARLLYSDLIRQAQADRHVLLCCEVNLDPPNPASDALHAALGFVEAGQAITSSKTVRYLTRPI